MRVPLLTWAWTCSAIVATTQSGCSTVLGLVDTEEEDTRSKIFVGVRLAERGASGGYEAGPDIFKLCFFIDFLPSAAADIALLPVTLVYELFRPKAALPPPKPPGQEQRKDRRRKGRRRRFS